MSGAVRARDAAGRAAKRGLSGPARQGQEDT